MIDVIEIIVRRYAFCSLSNGHPDSHGHNDEPDDGPQSKRMISLGIDQETKLCVI